MSETNHLKTPSEDSLRGTGKLGYGESSKLHSTIKRLVSTFDKEKVMHDRKKKPLIKCPGCNKKFRTNNGKIPAHKAYTGIDGKCPQRKNQFWAEVKIVSKVNSVIINEFEIVPGDTVAFTTYPFTFPFAGPHELKDYKVKNIFLMDNNEIYLEFDGIDQHIPSRIFVKNFIKL